MALEIMNFNFPSTKGNLEAQGSLGKKLKTSFKMQEKKTKGNLEAQGSLTRSSFRSEKKLSSQLSEKGNCFAKKISLLKVIVVQLTNIS